ncbi:MAG TPA: NrfD/PsrC family molybdoenzyme membrane anchor subunit [Gaiellaceae bacterium]|nr:NrfD/PsrC family molybdoenzyme membrane anchor subunit [Gaiellaceae bacterium]
MTRIEPNTQNGRPPGVTSWKGSITEAGTSMESYYGRPIIKEPVWQPEIPVYFFTGGLGGASAILSLAASAAGNEKLAKAARYWGAVGDNVSPLLLISDLGRPERFLNMLRVFKVTSPMSVGSWVLVCSSGASTTAAALELVGRLKPVKVAAEVVAALFGPLLATYTATLVSDTAVPVWHQGRHELPFVFGFSAGATAGAACALVLDPEDAGPARRLAIGGVVAENVAMGLMEARLGFVGEPYRKGAAGKLNVAAKGLTAVGAALMTRKRSRAAQIAGSALVLGGELALRWSVFKAGFQSARDPRYTVVPQKQRRAAKTAEA